MYWLDSNLVEYSIVDNYDELFFKYADLTNLLERNGIYAFEQYEKDRLAAYQWAEDEMNKQTQEVKHFSVQRYMIYDMLTDFTDGNILGLFVGRGRQPVIASSSDDDFNTVFRVLDNYDELCETTPELVRLIQSGIKLFSLKSQIRALG